MEMIASFSSSSECPSPEKFDSIEDEEHKTSNFDLFSDKPLKKTQKRTPEPPELFEQYDLDENGQSVFKRFWIRGKYLGKGGFSRVYVVHPEDNQDEAYAGKFVYKYLDRKMDIESEAQLHSEMNHENIVKYHFKFDFGDFHVIILERCETNLQSVLRSRVRLTEPEVRYYLKQIVNALLYVHSEGVMFRDLKAANVLLTRDLEVRLSDFGFAAKQFTSRQYCGTPNYVAPEVICREYYTRRVDVWALGVLAYTLLVGRCPFETESVKSTYRKILKAEVRFPGRVRLSKEAESFIRVALNKSDEKRATMFMMSRHPFLNDYPIIKTMPLIAAIARPNFEEYFSTPHKQTEDRE